MIINICNVEILLSTFIGRTQFFRSKQWTYSLSRFQIELVITNKTEYLSVTIDSIVTKHFLGYYITCSRTLVNNILH